VVLYEKALKQFQDKAWSNDLRTLSGERKKSPTPEEKAAYEQAQARVSELSEENRRDFDLALAGSTGLPVR